MRSNFQPDATKAVLYVTTSKDGTVVFDPQQDKLLRLNSMSIEMWGLLSNGNTESRVIEIIAQKCGVERQRVGKSLSNLLALMADAGFTTHCVLLTQDQPLDRAAGSPSRPWYGKPSQRYAARPTRSMVFCAIVGLLFFDLILSVFSMKSMCALVKAWPLRRPGGQARTNLVADICRAVEKACIWYPRSTLCLQRSAITTCLLRSHGVAARMAVGVRTIPFLPHAWVEAEGVVVNDFPRVAQFYSLLASY
jgi:hypothetical protein